MPVEPLPDHKRDDWVQAYLHLFVMDPSPAYVSTFEKLQSKAGITDRLIVAVIERGIETKRRHILAWAQTVLSELVPYGVKTPEDWAAHEAAVAAEDQRLAEQRAKQQAERQATARQKADNTTKRRLKESNVFLRREKMKSYDHVFEKLDD